MNSILESKLVFSDKRGVLSKVTENNNVFKCIQKVLKNLSGGDIIT